MSERYLSVLRPAEPPRRRRSWLEDLWWTGLTGMAAGLSLASFFFGSPLGGWAAAAVAWGMYRFGLRWSR